MDRRTWKKTCFKLFNTKDYSKMYVPIDYTPTLSETPELYLKLTKRCMEQASQVPSVRGFPVLKFNQKQCQYLLDKLKLAIQRTNLNIKEINTKFLLITSREDTIWLLLIFKLLYAMAMEVENFIQSCTKEAWMQSSIMLTNTSEHVASIGFNLEFCTIVFSNKKMGTTTSLILSEVESIREGEAKIVKEIANLDERNMMEDLGAIIRSNVSSNVEWKLATFLLGRLEMTKLHVGASLPRLNERSHSQMVMNLETMPDCLGKGACGTVHKAMWFGTKVAQKTFYGPKHKDFLQEVSILEGLSHPNIISLLWYMMDGKKCHLIMELMDADLYSLMQERIWKNGNDSSPFSIQEALDLMLQIGEGMLFLHEKRIVHRDLKSSNILVRCRKAMEGNMEYLKVKVADFGLSRTKENSISYSDLTQNVGTTRWMAPEVMTSRNEVDIEGEVQLKFPFKIDVYSFGMVCYEILSGDVPFSNMTNGEVKRAILGGDRPELPKECPERLKTLIRACWSFEASSRPSFGDICMELRNLKYANLMTYWIEGISQCSPEDKAAILAIVARLSSTIAKVQQIAAFDIRVLSRMSRYYRMCIVEVGAIPLLVALLLSPDQKTQLHAISTLLTLSTSDRIRKQIVSTDAIEPIVEVLKSGCVLARKAATMMLSNLSSVKENQVTIGNSSAIPALVILLHNCLAQGKMDSTSALLNHAISALLHLSLNDNNKAKIVAAGAIEPIVEVLSIGCMEVREIVAVILNILSFDREKKIMIGNSGAIPALVTLLQDKAIQGETCAINALMKLSMIEGNKLHAIRAGVIPSLMRLIAKQPITMLAEALGLLAILATHPEGCRAIGAIGSIHIWMDIIISESPRNKENALAILLGLCSHVIGYFKQAKESNAIEPLTILLHSQDSTVRAKRKARAILELLKMLEQL